MGTVYVGNVSGAELKEKGALSELFRDAAGAKATDEHLVKESGGGSRGHAYLTFGSSRDYARALELSGFELHGYPLLVRPAKPPSAPTAAWRSPSRYASRSPSRTPSPRRRRRSPTPKRSPTTRRSPSRHRSVSSRRRRRSP